MIELYRASSVVERLQIDGFVFQGGVIHWYNTSERQGSPYRELVEGYDTLDPRYRIYCQELIDEFLTKDETEMLDAYLNATGNSTFQLKNSTPGPLRIRKVDMPVDQAQMGYRHMPRGGTGMHYPLNTRDDYDLPTTIAGYFDPMEEGFHERIEEGTAYVRRALQMLGVDEGIKRPEIKAVVRKLYDREALYVTSEAVSSVLEIIAQER